MADSVAIRNAGFNVIVLSTGRIKRETITSGERFAPAKRAGCNRVVVVLVAETTNDRGKLNVPYLNVFSRLLVPVGACKKPSLYLSEAMKSGYLANVVVFLVPPVGGPTVVIAD